MKNQNFLIGCQLVKVLRKKMLLVSQQYPAEMSQPYPTHFCAKNDYYGYII